MLARAFPVSAVALLVACASGGPAPGDPSTAAAGAGGVLFRYGVPTPPTATYEIADTMTMIITTPDMEMDMAMANASTVTLTHSADPDGAGISVSGTVSDYSSSMSSSMFGDMPTGEATVSGELEFVLGPLGDVEMVSTPEVSQADGMPVIPYLLNTDVLFPRFPEHPLRVGDTWADTTTSSADLDDAAAGLTGTVTGTTITAYTLVGDTVVDGKTYQKITFSGFSEGETSADDPGGDPAVGDNITTNALEGFFLWDADRGLVAFGEQMRTSEGSMMMMGAPSAMTGAGPSRVRLVN